MPVSINEFHPFAACLMFKACKSSRIVRANLEEVVYYGEQIGMGEKERAEDLLWQVDAVARYRGDEYGVPDQIDNHGKPYQSAQLLEELQRIDQRR